MNKPVNMGLVGVGRAGWGGHIYETKDKQDLFKVVAACDVIPERAERVKELYPDCKTYIRIEDLIADPEVEFVTIATRSCDHYIHARMALIAGKHVQVEKPMCVSYNQACELAELSGKNGNGKLFVRHNRRFESDFVYAKELIESGKLGMVYHIRLSRGNYQRRDDWQTLARFGGGQLFNWGPHIVDHSLLLLDAKVKKFFSYLTQVAAAGDCEDHLNLYFVGENDRFVEMEISGGSALSNPEYMIFGTHGAVTINQGAVHMRYINPEQKLIDIVADPETPGKEFGSTGTFASGEQIDWLEENINIPQAEKMDQTWTYIYESIRNNAPYPITLEQATEVMKYLDIAKRESRFCYGVNKI
jgi:scyllo-inositol 2-dehydrogenase (NADP+)